MHPARIYDPAQHQGRWLSVVVWPRSYYVIPAPSFVLGFLSLPTAKGQSDYKAHVEVCAASGASGLYCHASGS